MNEEIIFLYKPTQDGMPYDETIIFDMTFYSDTTRSNDHSLALKGAFILTNKCARTHTSVVMNTINAHTVFKHEAVDFIITFPSVTLAPDDVIGNCATVTATIVETTSVS